MAIFIFSQKGRSQKDSFQKDRFRKTGQKSFRYYKKTRQARGQDHPGKKSPRAQSQTRRSPATRQADSLPGAAKGPSACFEGYAARLHEWRGQR